MGCMVYTEPQYLYKGALYLFYVIITSIIIAIVKMPCKQVSLSIGAPLRNLEGIRFPGLFERKG